MIRDIEILNDLKKVQTKIEYIKNPLNNDFCGSHFWGDIYEQVSSIIDDIDNNLKLFNILKNESN